jgi:predicted ATPase/transcriptional regulator with XRE-family HTH domain
MPTVPSGSSHPRFGDLLRRFRVARGLTQERLAERTGLSVRGISDLERGARTIPHRETILRLIEGLELPEDEQALLLSFARRGPRRSDMPVYPGWSFGSAGRTTGLDEFVGRANELTAVMRALHDPGSRLLTLTGPPGVGKTRLAIEATQRLVALVSPEVVFVDLAPIRNPTLVLPAIAASVGLREAATSTLRDRLEAHLRARPAVLLLDNFEHLLAASPVVDALLQVNAEVRILVTSREPLRLCSEYVLPVLPLATPHLSVEMGVRDVIAHEAVALFVARARESDRGFHLTDDNARAIAELCVRLDGLPLALELAAARVKHLSPAAIAERLAQRRPVLTAGWRELPERQRTLADAIDWSYDLLREDEQYLFRRLSVFLGGFTPQAAETVANSQGDLDLSHALTFLADKSLIARQSARAGSVRFTMLETIREFGLERLAASGEETAVREAHATYFMVLAEDALRDMEAATAHRAAIERLGDDYDNLRQALTWALEQADPSPLLRLTQSLWRFWWGRGHLSEGGRWLEHALERGRNAPPVSRARTLIAAGRLAWLRGEFAVATRRLEQALALGPEPFDRCEALNALGDVAREEGDYERAEAALVEAAVIGRAHEDWFHLGASLHNLGIVELERGCYDRARAALEEGLVWARRVESKYLIYSVLHYLSRLAFEQGDYGRAAALRREDLTLQRELAPLNTHGAARFFEGVALLAIVQHESAPAARMFGVAARLREEVENSEGAERQKIALWVVAAREKLGDKGFTREWKTGRALSLQTALDEAAALLAGWRWTASHDA